MGQLFMVVALDWGCEVLLADILSAGQPKGAKNPSNNA